MKKVLIITYYWIPSGGSGVQRWVKFVKYLRNFGWEPIVYTPENPEYPSTDHSFLNDIPTDITVLKTPIWEPYNVYRKLTSKGNEPIKAGFISENKKHGWKDKLSVWIRGNFLIPDPRKYWIKPSVSYLSTYLKENSIDAIITTGPPHSMHFIGLGLKKNFPNIPWVADFRDPWTSIYFYKDLKIGWLANKQHHRLERKIIQSTDCVLVVSQGMKQEYENLNPKRIEVVSNGYDEADLKHKECVLDSKFSISHIGLLTPKQNPYILWKVLSEICYDDPLFRADLAIQLVGNIDFSVIELIKQFGLYDQLYKSDYLPHSEAINRQRSSQILLLLLMNEPGNKCILTGKLFEYLSAKRPILAFGPTDGDAARVIMDANAGIMIDFNDEKMTRKVILNHYKQFKSGNLSIESVSLHQYSRENLTKKLAGILSSCLQP